MTNITAIILAAGKGSRFKSELPKVLHTINNKPMIHYVIESVNHINIESVCLVVGHKKELVKKSCENYNVNYANQDQQLGTGHAVVCALNKLETIKDHCIVLAGDCPLITSDTLSELITIHINSNAAASVLTASIPDAGNYGRIIRNNNKQITAIREAKDCSENELKIKEFNSGIYCFNTKKLTECIQKLSTNNAQGEYYLTDVIEFFSTSGDGVSGLCTKKAWEVSGANTQDELTQMAGYIEK